MTRAVYGRSGAGGERNHPTRGCVPSEVQARESAIVGCGHAFTESDEVCELFDSPAIGTRIPRMHGAPPMTAGSTVMRVNVIR